VTAARGSPTVMRLSFRTASTIPSGSRSRPRASWSCFEDNTRFVEDFGRPRPLEAGSAFPRAPCFGRIGSVPAGGREPRLHSGPAPCDTARALARAFAPRRGPSPECPRKSQPASGAHLQQTNQRRRRTGRKAGRPIRFSLVAGSG
jgi:hypothetical protein